MADKMLAIGLMSGTSLDGVDAALIETDGDRHVRPIAFRGEDYSDAARAQLAEATTAALLDLGCARVVALDRGGHQASFVHRAGTDASPAARYEASALFAIEAPMRGRGARFE